MIIISGVYHRTSYLIRTSTELFSNLWVGKNPRKAEYKVVSCLTNLWASMLSLQVRRVQRSRSGRGVTSLLTTAIWPLIVLLASWLHCVDKQWNPTKMFQDYLKLPLAQTKTYCITAGLYHDQSLPTSEIDTSATSFPTSPFLEEISQSHVI